MTPTVARGEERMLYTAQVNAGGFHVGAVYEMEAEDVERHAGLIEAGFLVPTEDRWAGLDARDFPEPEALSAVGTPDEPGTE